MRKLLLLAIAVLGMSTAQAQDIRGFKTLSVIAVPQAGPVSAKVFVMAQKDFVEQSYVSAIGYIEVLGTKVEAGKFYILTLTDGNITGIEEL